MIFFNFRSGCEDATMSPAPFVVVGAVAGAAVGTVVGLIVDSVRSSDP
jgi:hypothetical protein